MNYKAILIAAVLAIALCAMPVSAVWMNGNWITQEEYDKITDGATVVHNPGSDVTSKYRDTNPAKSTEVFVGANTCTLEGNVRAGFNTLTKEVLIANVLAPNDTMVIPILPDGTFRYEGLAQGNYILKIVPQFEGLGPEQVSSVTCDHGVARPESELLGYAISVSDAKCVPSYTIESATYGASEQRCHMETVIDAEGYDEIVPAVTHIEYSYWIYGHFGCKPGEGSGCGSGQHWGWIDGSWSEWQITNPQKCVQKTKVVTDTPAYTIHHPAETHEDEVCVEYGDVKDVTSNVQQAVASGHTSFLFNNAENPGGIFDVTTTERLSTIEDPAYGIVKHVSIDYKDCNGMEQHVSTEEYCTIDLAAGTATCPSQTPA